MAMATVAVSVSTCGDCPFAVSPEVEIDDWACSVVDADGLRTLGGGPDFQPWGPPPAWCPLRRVDHLVTLRRADPRRSLPVIQLPQGVRVSPELTLSASRIRLPQGVRVSPGPTLSASHDPVDVGTADSGEQDRSPDRTLTRGITTGATRR